MVVVVVVEAMVEAWVYSVFQVVVVWRVLVNDAVWLWMVKTVESEATEVPYHHETTSPDCSPQAHHQTSSS